MWRGPARAARGSARCRRASSRNAARAIRRRWSSGRSRRRDGRRCRRASCALSSRAHAPRVTVDRCGGILAARGSEDRRIGELRRVAEAAVLRDRPRVIKRSPTRVEHGGRERRRRRAVAPARQMLGAARRSCAISSRCVAPGASTRCSTCGNEAGRSAASGGK